MRSTEPGTERNEGAVVRDILLESLVIAENSSQLLSAAWSVLIKHEGRLLKLLLDRFRFVATIPDLRVSELLGNRQAPLYVEAAFRTPIWPYWRAVLQMLDGHLAEVIEHAPAEAILICKTWLEKTPPELAPGTKFPCRNHAASVALGIAREYQAQRAEEQYPKSDIEQKAYETALLSANDLPDKVAAFALEMAKRKPLPPAIQSRAEAAKIAAEEELLRWKSNTAEKSEVAPELPEALFWFGTVKGPVARRPN